MADAEALAQRVLQAAPRGALHALLLPDGADLQAARAAFRRLSLLLHPDKCAGSALAAEAFKAVNVALHSVQEAAEAHRERAAGEHSRWREFDACSRAGVRSEAGSCAARGAAGGCEPRAHAPGPQLPAAAAPSARRWAAPVLPAPPPPPTRTPAAARKRSRGAGACRAGPPHRSRLWATRLWANVAVLAAVRPCVNLYLSCRCVLLSAHKSLLVLLTSCPAGFPAASSLECNCSANVLGRLPSPPMCTKLTQAFDYPSPSLQEPAP